MPRLRRWGEANLATLRRHQREIDELNVYPVPDVDTGLVRGMAAVRLPAVWTPSTSTVGSVNGKQRRRHRAFETA